MLTTLQGRFNVISRDNGLGVFIPFVLWHADANPFRKTIVSTSLPTIESHFNASQTEYTWVGVSYMLTQTVCQPFYGRLSDLVGRKVSYDMSYFFDHRISLHSVEPPVQQYIYLRLGILAMRFRKGSLCHRPVLFRTPALTFVLVYDLVDRGERFGRYRRWRHR